MDDCYILRVSQLNEYVAGMLRRETLLQHIGVRGEISGFKRHSSGHLYFSLKDESALIRCVMFRTKAAGLKCELRDGMQVIAFGGASLFVRDGQYQFYVESVQAEGEGELYRQFLQTKRRLEEKGYFDPSHKKKLPVLPRCIGVVTSLTGAVIHDIENVTRRRFPSMPILLYPAAVQGPGAASEIAEGIRTMNRLGKADVLIVGRGGGSMEDLWPFNEEAVAKAIYESDIPVISAVGHETDESIADYAADCRAPTPSAAAELCVPDYDALYGAIQEYQRRLRNAFEDRIAFQRAKLSSISGSAAFASPGHCLQISRERISRQTELIGREARTILMDRGRMLEELRGRCEALSPMRVLERGYAIVRKDGECVKDGGALQKSDKVEILLASGGADAIVTETWKGKDRQ